jgi:hypothetical protein
MGRTGIEHPEKVAENPHVSLRRGAKSGAVRGQNPAPAAPDALVAAVLAISALPLEPGEKAAMVRRLLGGGQAVDNSAPVDSSMERGGRT